MHAKRLAIGLGALAAAALAAGSAAAADTVRLSLPGSTSAPTINLKATAADVAADTVPVYYRGGFRGGYGGYRGGYGGYRGFGGYRGYYGGYRAFGPRYYGGYGFYRPRYYGGLGLGLGLGLGYGLIGPRYYGGYYGGYGGYGSAYYSTYYTPQYYYYPSYSSYPTLPGLPYLPIGSTSVTVQPSTVVIRPASSASTLPAPELIPQAGDVVPAPGQLAPGQSAPGTYPYDGGPPAPVPMPPAEETAVSLPRLTKPEVVESLAVALPGKTTGKWVYPAYGEKPTRQGTR